MGRGSLSVTHTTSAGKYVTAVNSETLCASAAYVRDFCRNEARYRPGGAQRVPGSYGSQI